MIDVLRAGTFACMAFRQGASRIVCVDDPGAALDLADRLDGSMLAGERDGVPPPGFHTGNSPALISGTDLSGITVVHCTSAGTRGLVEASSRCARTAVACFANATAAVRAASTSTVVSILAMGEGGERPAFEDELCADLLERLLREPAAPREPPLGAVIASGAADRILQSGSRWIPAEDLDWCAGLDWFDAVPMVTGRIRGWPVLDIDRRL